MRTGTYFFSSTCKQRYRLDPSHHCVTMAKLGFRITPINSKTLTCLVFFNTDTSFLNACNWAAVGCLTFRALIATGPCQLALYTVPNDPDPMQSPICMSVSGISQSSNDSWGPVSRSNFLVALSSALLARGLGLSTLVGEAWALWLWGRKPWGTPDGACCLRFSSAKSSQFMLTMLRHTFGSELDLSP